jgi:hypothetical protein
MSELKSMFSAEIQQIQRGVMPTVNLMGKRDVPLFGIGTSLLMLLVLGLPAGLLLSLVGLPILAGFAGAVVVLGLMLGSGLLLWVWMLVVRGYAHPIVNGVSARLRMVMGLYAGVALAVVLKPVSPWSTTITVLLCVAASLMALLVVAPQLAGRQLWRGLWPAGRVRPVTPSPAVGLMDSPIRKPFALGLGVATGHMSSQSHGAGIAQGVPVVLGLGDAATNIITFGGIGSGKTTKMINPLLLQVLSQDTGALIFDIKTDFVREVDYLAKQAGRPYQVIGLGGLDFNLLEGLTPEVAASFMKSAFLRFGGGGGESGFFIDGAVEYCRNALNLLQYLPAQYSLIGLYDFIFDAKRYTEVVETVAAMVHAGEIGEREQRMVVASQRYFELVWAPKEEKEKNYLRSTAAQVLSPFSHPEMVDAFCTIGGNQARMEDLVTKGVVYLVNIPMTTFGKEGSLAAYLFIKLRFMQVMRERNMRSEWDQTRPVAFVCDEYQTIIDTVSDTDFWDKSRSSKTIGIVSMQGISSMVAALGGNEKTARAILQNFRQRVLFRSEDEETLKMVQTLMGEVDVAKISESTGHSTNDSKHGGSSGDNNSRSVSYQRQSVVNPQLFRQLGRDQAVAILNINGAACDDVINCRPIYLPN